MADEGKVVAFKEISIDYKPPPPPPTLAPTLSSVIRSCGEISSHPFVLVFPRHQI